MLYRVTNKYGRSGHEKELRKFQTIDEAKNFIKDELSNAASLKINVSFFLYEGIDLIEEFDATKAEEISQADEASSGAGGKGSGASFRPTPFNTSPSPKGMPKHWLKNGDEDDEKK